ncbi:RFT1 [Candida oxycetoniae]|uniref:Man(5)GlcNAc(2)-PP-dolichol translocation protein RFT1 n=1 Tax=Candida oxycetoniae TaxID=497107 RepID=A0AAI9SZE6_9ASCO|nr:RFT1 [Candida oxycetoniae]KAI3405973.2 RFT1 [Candida oxycetoniae]
MIRFISAPVFGIAAYLDFLQSSVLFFSRESIRLSVQRVKFDQSKTKTLQKVVNLGSVATLLGVPITIIVGYLQGYRSANFQDFLLKLPFHKLAIATLLVSTFLELAIEPIYCVYQYDLDIGKRTKFEGVAMFMKCAMTFVCVLLSSRFFEGREFDGVATLSFVLGQFAYSFTLFAMYLYSFSGFNKANNTNLQLFVVPVDEGKTIYFDFGSLQIFKSFFVQMIFKQLLTEGDRFLISYLCTIEEQGIYAIVTNYGSIIARLLFQPLEESTRLMLTKVINNGSSDGDTRSLKASYFETFTYIKMICLFYFNLCLFIIFAGVTNGPFLLKFLIRRGDNWSKSDIYDLFLEYIAYIPFLAFNGIFEAIFTSAAKSDEVKRYSKFMTVMTISLLAVSYYLITILDLRLSGLIIANMLNMSLRMIYCFKAIAKYYGAAHINIDIFRVLQYITPSVIITAATFATQHYIVFKGRSFIAKDWSELIQGIIGSGILLFNLLILERQNLERSIKSFFKKKEKKST